MVRVGRVRVGVTVKLVYLEAGGEAAVGTAEAATQTEAATQAVDKIAAEAREGAKVGEIPAAEAREALADSFGSSASEEAEDGASSLLSRAAARSDAAAEAGEAGSSSSTTATAGRTATTATEDTSTTENPLTSKAKKWNSSWYKSAESVELSEEDVEELRVARSSLKTLKRQRKP
jgi:hypothetical protein